MKKIILSLLIVLGLISAPLTFAQGMMREQSADDAQVNSEMVSATKDEAEGKAVWEKLNSKETDCKSLSEDDYDVLGDYFMGLMSGSGHASMNSRMTQMMGDAGEKAMHVYMGKRLSGCDTTASISSEYTSFLPWGTMMENGNAKRFLEKNGLKNMMDFNKFFGIHLLVGGVSLVLVWTALILSITALIRYLKASKKK